jgi:hypothetical protein
MTGRTTMIASSEPTGWTPGMEPWIRQAPPGTRFLCYFCGETTAILSHGDRPDPGRAEVYCENNFCEVRRVAIIILQDGTLATIERTDVRTLDAIDKGAEPDEPLHPLAAVDGRTDEAVIARRLGQAGQR